MEDLSYTSNATALHTRIEQQLSIGMLYSDPGSGYQAKLNHAVLEACSSSRRYLAVELFDESRQDWRPQLEDFLDRTKVRNIILVPPMCDSSELHSLLNERGVQFALISPSRAISGASSITMDDRLAAMEMTQHLIKLGHKRIGHIYGDSSHVATLLRRQGYEEALMRAGLGPIDDDIILSGRFSFKHALTCADRMLTSDNRPTAIFASNDEMAAAVVMTANRLGLSVPCDLSVAGFDNTPISQTIWPELTTVAQPFKQIAQEAVRLMSQVGGVSADVSQTRVLPHELLVRASTGPAPLS